MVSQSASSTYLPTARHPRLLEGFDPEQSHYACLRERLGMVFARADEVIEMVLATAAAPRAV